MLDVSVRDVEAGCKKVLVVLHQEHSVPGRVGRMLQAMGYGLDIRRPRFGDPLPQHMDDHAGAVVFGGPMSANDPDDFVKREIDWIGVPLRDKAPFLGICLGAQMLARHLGQKVYPHPQGLVEVGYYPIHPTQAAETLFGGTFPRRVYQWHREGFDMPAGGTLLATGLDFECQAFNYGSAFGLQFHPEVTYAMMCKWTTTGHERMSLPNARPTRGHHLEGWFQHDAAVARWTDAFLHGWINRNPTLFGPRFPGPSGHMPVEHAFEDTWPDLQAADAI